jgi:peptidoglycan/xylan/chitin deacetylase (PgdA/CDA1 family)
MSGKKIASLLLSSLLVLTLVIALVGLLNPSLLIKEKVETNSLPTKLFEQMAPVIITPKEESNSKNSRFKGSKLQEYVHSPKVAIFMYHSIDTFESIGKNEITPALSRGNRIPPEILKKHLQILAKNEYKTITFKELQDFKERKIKIPEKSVILSFDDGWADNFGAFKIVQEAKAVASFGIVSSFVDKSNRLSSPQLKEMFEAGMEIASHSKTHANLANLSGESLKEELEHPKKLLEQITNSKVETLIYPAGKFNDNTIKVAQELGYKMAATTIDYNSDNGQPLSLKPFELTRIRVQCPATANPRTPECPNLGTSFYDNKQ